VTATGQEIKDWIKEGIEQGAEFLVVAVDTYDYENYPIYVASGEDVKTIVKEHSGPNMQRVDEVYSLRSDIESQFAEYRSFHMEHFS
jgi:hypothetical protein